MEFSCYSSSMKGSPGTHPHALHDDPDADDWNSVDSFQRDDDVYHLTQQMEKLQNQVSTLVQSQANQEDNVSKLRQDNAGLTERLVKHGTYSSWFDWCCACLHGTL